MARWVISNPAALIALRKGVNTLSRAVSITLGPKGRSVVLDRRWKGASVVSDGFTIAQEVELPDPQTDIGVQFIKDAAGKVRDSYGDGTSTTIVLAAAIIDEALKNIFSGANPVALNQGIRLGTSAMVEALRAHSVPASDSVQLRQVATLAAKDPRIGELISEVLQRVGHQGVILVESSEGTDLSVEYLEGMQLDGGYLSSHFVTDRKRMEAVIESPRILITYQKLRVVEDILPALERIVPVTKKILIVCEAAEGEALAGLVMNNERGLLNVAAVKAPGLGERRREFLTDLAVFTGGRLVPDRETGRTLQTTDQEDWGQAGKVIVDSVHTTVLNGRGDPQAIRSRMKSLDSQIAEAQTDVFRAQLRKRLGALAGHTAVLHVGAPTESEAKEKKQRVENAVAAVRSAIQSGVLPGGGTSLLHALAALDHVEASGDEKTGLRIIERAAARPLRHLAQNAGIDGSLVILRLQERPFGFGFNAETGEFGDLWEMGIIEPEALVEGTLVHAVSIATSILSVAAMVVSPPETGPGGEKLDMSAKYA